MYLCNADANTLYSKIYEITEEKDTDKENKEKDDRYSALWRYRTRLSLEHLSHSILSKNHKILNAFLQQVKYGDHAPKFL